MFKRVTSSKPNVEWYNYLGLYLLSMRLKIVVVVRLIIIVVRLDIIAVEIEIAMNVCLYSNVAIVVRWK